MEMKPAQRTFFMNTHDLFTHKRPVLTENRLKKSPLILILCTLLLFIGSFALLERQKNVMATGCSWHTIEAGDTLGKIASNYHTTIRSLAQANNIKNIDLIYAGQKLCITHTSNNSTSQNQGIQSGGVINWYSYSSLDWSTRNEVVKLIRQAAANYGLPAKLVLAIAWEESNWNQHVISHDGGIGTMQLMPYTAYGLNVELKANYNPYKLWDNIVLGTYYLRTLWNSFHGKLSDVISAYNEGGWNVTHRGIFNWHYVLGVESFMSTLS